MLGLLAPTMADARKAGVVVAQKNDRKIGTPKSIHLPTSEYRLKNELRVIISKDHAALNPDVRLLPSGISEVSEILWPDIQN